jgi:hypothetical protein
MEITHKNQGELDSTMLPFVMRELVELVMKKKALPLGDALYYIYSSKLYLIYIRGLGYEAFQKSHPKNQKPHSPKTTTRFLPHFVSFPPYNSQCRTS